jgi:hypothetical protein
MANKPGSQPELGKLRLTGNTDDSEIVILTVALSRLGHSLNVGAITKQMLNL